MFVLCLRAKFCCQPTPTAHILAILSGVIGHYPKIMCNKGSSSNTPLTCTGKFRYHPGMLGLPEILYFLKFFWAGRWHLSHNQFFAATFGNARRREPLWQEIKVLEIFCKGSQGQITLCGTFFIYIVIQSYHSGREVKLSILWKIQKVETFQKIFLFSVKTDLKFRLKRCIWIRGIWKIGVDFNRGVVSPYRKPNLCYLGSHIPGH